MIIKFARLSGVVEELGLDEQGFYVECFGVTLYLDQDVLNTSVKRAAMVAKTAFPERVVIRTSPLFLREIAEGVYQISPRYTFIYTFGPSKSGKIVMKRINPKCFQSKVKGALEILREFIKTLVVYQPKILQLKK